MRSRSKIGASLRRTVLAAACIIGLNTASSAAFFNVCAGCYSGGISNLSCGVYVLTAIAGCCGMGDGNASCSGSTFSVSCEAGGSCSCDVRGENCSRGGDPLPE